MKNKLLKRILSWHNEKRGNPKGKEWGMPLVVDLKAIAKKNREMPLEEQHKYSFFK